MTLRELREVIDDLVYQSGVDVLELPVYAEYDYGNRAHTRALVKPRDVMVKIPYESAYSDSGLAIRSSDREEDGERVVVLLSR